MTAHHPWCEPGACSLDAIHRGPRAVVISGRSVVSCRLVQALSDPAPSIMVATVGRTRGRAARLDADAARRVIAELTAQLQQVEQHVSITGQ